MVKVVGNLDTTYLKKYDTLDYLNGKMKIRELDWSTNEDEINDGIGKSNSLLYPRQEAVHHPLYNRLLEYATIGCPTNCGTDWTKDHIITAIKRGPHSSTIKYRALQALHK